MRGMKFRARDKYSGEWIDFTLETLMQGHFYEPEALEHWRQYTGIKDKNGVEIYEGDVVGPPHVATVWKVGEVMYRGAAFRVHGFVLIEISDQVEVIGNIHENPELLEGMKHEV